MPKLSHLTKKFSKFSSKARGLAPQTPLEVTCGSRRNTKVKQVSIEGLIYILPKSQENLDKKHAQIKPFNNNFFQIFFKSWGAGPPDPPCSNLWQQKKQIKVKQVSIEGLIYILPKSQGNLDKKHAHIDPFNNHCSNFSSKAGGLAPQTPLEVAYDIR